MKVFFEFVGGPRDAELLEGCPEQSDIQLFDIDAATAYYWGTNYGAEGAEFYVLSPFAAPKRQKHIAASVHPPEHKYVISDRVEENDDVWIVARYVGPVASANVPPDHKCPWYERLVNLGMEEITSVHVNFPEIPFRSV